LGAQCGHHLVAHTRIKRDYKRVLIDGPAQNSYSSYQNN
jgi:hypothetical protein